jgi:hypothetical protein
MPYVRPVDGQGLAFVNAARADLLRFIRPFELRAHVEQNDRVALLAEYVCAEVIATATYGENGSHAGLSDDPAIF